MYNNDLVTLNGALLKQVREAVTMLSAYNDLPADAQKCIKILTGEFAYRLGQEAAVNDGT